MLRVRMIIRTPDLPGAARFLRSLGLDPARDPAPTGSAAVFDAGGGRVSLHSCPAGSPEEGATGLAFDVSDVREFARRTVEAGTAVDLSGKDDGFTARITAPDGLSFLADAGPRETDAPASPLTVLALWSTPEVTAAVQVMRDIGARPRIGPDAGSLHGFEAKNGGFVAVHAGDRPRIGLGFEYDGDVRDLVGGYTEMGLEPAVVGGSSGYSLGVRAPWGAEIRIGGSRRDQGPRTGVPGPAVASVDSATGRRTARRPWPGAGLL